MKTFSSHSTSSFSRLRWVKIFSSKKKKKNSFKTSLMAKEKKITKKFRRYFLERRKFFGIFWMFRHKRLFLSWERRVSEFFGGFAKKAQKCEKRSTGLNDATSLGESLFHELFCYGPQNYYNVSNFESVRFSKGLFRKKGLDYQM